ncbi:palmitoyltransferase [Plakobranchus ocellatus]|uniref:Palmitoyltransferase n=1 Tax=Plakobranchus ocellatus TaxID=259542 RepID=A0AAV3Y537_9GAST|nr:palmitoyltransferase [Plakobranchus ocellatus]
MDHHCPWLSRCIGFHNHKYFILFIHYLFAFSIFIVITCSGILPRIWRRDLKDKVDNRQADERRMGRLKLQLGTKLLGAFNATDNPRPADVASVSTSLVAGTGLSSAFIQVFFLIILFLVLACMLTPLLRLQEELLAWNITTLEKFRPVGIPGGDFNSDIFNMGSVSVNLNQIMGPNRWLWIFPVFTSVGDGVHYDVNVI